MTSFVIALNACAKVNVFVTTAVVIPRNAHAPTGNGDKTKPATVAKKMDNKFQACGTTPSGLGTTKQTNKPKPMDIAAAFKFAPFQTKPSELADLALGEVIAEEEEEAFGTINFFIFFAVLLVTLLFISLEDFALESLSLDEKSVVLDKHCTGVVPLLFTLLRL
jgi:hypothetical protein